jgi:phosphatidylinositol-3-phosphatase
VSFDNDMHIGSVRDGDTWLKVHLSAYAEWAKMHNSLLIATFDEDDYKSENRIPTIIYGARVRPGRYAERITHYRSSVRFIYFLFRDKLHGHPTRVLS